MSHLNCMACGRPLTREYRWGGKGEYDLHSADRAPALPPGVAVRLDDEDAVLVRHGDGTTSTHVYSPPGAIALNPLDVLTDDLLPHGPDNGCCGSDGQDGPNRTCQCGAVVATEWSDCWTQAEVRFLPQAVVAIEPSAA
jgi:DNA-directed RNA polymerase subunit N (RpoN/RPB10)